jgi:O-6-methylguanine DNA methyltransferase
MTKSALPIGFDSAEEARYSAAFDALIDAGGGVNTDAIAVQWVASPVGPLLIGASDAALRVLEFSSTAELAERIARLRKHLGRSLVRQDNAILVRLRAQLREYFAGVRRDFDVPLEFHGSEFQERVWGALRTIPYGETRSYGAIAKQLGDAGAMRAVGGANGMNPIAIVIPCHRVVNASGDLGGFGGGPLRKRILLDLERGQGSLF